MPSRRRVTSFLVLCALAACVGVYAPLTLAVLPFNCNGPARVWGPIAPATGAEVLEWAPDDRGLLFTTAERMNVWYQPLAGGEPTALTKISDVNFFYGDLTADGRSLIAARGAQQRDAFLISNFR